MFMGALVTSGGLKICNGGGGKCRMPRDRRILTGVWGGGGDEYLNIFLKKVNSVSSAD